MARILLLFLSLFFLYSCNQQTKQETFNTDSVPVENQINVTQKTNDTVVDFTQYKIERGAIGPIKIGMMMQDADRLLQRFQRKEYTSTDLGFDGGSKAFVYSYKNLPVLATVSQLNSDSIIFLVAYHEKLISINSIHVGSSVKELQAHYPNLKVEFDRENEWEYIEDEGNGLSYIFATTENNRIGIYPTIESDSEPQNLLAKIDWISIR